MTCQARPDRYEPSTMRCAKCRLQWDVDDPEPPLCGLQVATRDLGERLSSSEGYVSALADQGGGYVSALAPDIFLSRRK